MTGPAERTPVPRSGAEQRRHRAERPSQASGAAGLFGATGEHLKPEVLSKSDTQATSAALQMLQRTVGNRAVAALVSVQRDGEATPSREDIIRDFRQMTEDGDWYRAARHLGGLNNPDIIRQLRVLSATALEHLVEGARHGMGVWDAQRVIDRVVEVNLRAAIVGTIRFHVWKHQWEQAAEYLNGLERSDARALESELISSGHLEKENLKKIADSNPNLKLQPGDVVNADGHDYVIYASEVRLDGTLAWMNNNPGNLRPSSSGDLLFGAIGKHRTPKGSFFLIFPDYTTGKAAIVKNLHAYGKITMGDAIAKWAPAKDHNDPASYAATVARRMGVSTRDDISGFSKAQFDQMADAIETVEGSTAGTVLARDDAKLPREIRDRL